MSAEWKPGDVAMSTQGRVMRCSFAYGKKLGWVYDDGSGSPGNDPGVLRPLAVIDPEDREAVERFRQIASRLADWVDYDAEASAYTDAMQAALREFADPKPPRPEEPMGLGAVVEDEDGSILTRIATDGNLDWVNTSAVSFEWADVAAVRILSPGVEVAQ